MKCKSLATNNILFILLCCVFAYGCTTTPTELKTAESLMESKPDSALHILKDLNSNQLVGTSNKALFALLMSQALDKNDIKLETDSLISIATDYYHESDPLHAGYAWFYHARTANNRDSINEQARNLLRAQEYAEQTDDYKLRGLIYGEKGIMYKIQLQFDSSIHYSKLAYRAFSQIEDYRNSVLSLLNTGDLFLNLSKNDSVLKYYLLAEKIVLKTNDILLSSTVYRAFGSIYYKFRNYKLSLYYYTKAPLTHIAIYDSNKYYLIAKTYIQVNEIDSARKYLEKVTELQNMAPDYYRLWQAIYKKRGNTQKYIFYANKENLAIDSLYSI